MSLLDRITERAAELSQQVERLRKQLADVEYELERVTTAEQVVTQLLDQDPRVDHAEEAVEGGVFYSVAASARPVRVAIPHRNQAGEESELPGDYRRILQIVAEAGTPVQAKTVCQALEGVTEPGRVETTRSKLKRLAERGWLHRNGAGMFTVLP